MVLTASSPGAKAIIPFYNYFKVRLCRISVTVTADYDESIGFRLVYLAVLS